MTGYIPKMTRGDRAYRREKVAAAYASGLLAREVAEKFGMNISYVKAIFREHGVARRVGRPRTNPIFQET